MAEMPDRTETGFDDDDFGTGSLVRMASWGIGASGALFLAVLAALSDSAAPRVGLALSTVKGKAEQFVTVPLPAAPSLPAVTTVPQPQQPNVEVRRLTEQVRLLVADRDRLAQRVSTLERNLDDMTGSIRRQQAAVQKPSETKPESAAPPPAAPAEVTASDAAIPAPWPAPPSVMPAVSPWGDPPATEPAPDATASLAPATPLPLPRPELDGAEALPAAEAPSVKPVPGRQASLAARPEHGAGRPAYGIDLGGAVSVDRLRMLWHTLRTNEPRLLQGLRPITHAREVTRGGRPDVRLIAGPVASAEDAARLCTEVLNTGRYCEPAVFHGQRMSLR